MFLTVATSHPVCRYHTGTVAPVFPAIMLSPVTVYRHIRPSEHDPVIIMLTLAHHVAGRIRNRRGNSTRSTVHAWSLPVERHVIPLGSKSAAFSVSETAQRHYTHNTGPQQGNGLAKNACEKRAILQAPS